RLRRAIFLLVVLVGLLALPIIQMVIPVALFLAALPLAFLVSDGTTRQFSAALSVDFGTVADTGVDGRWRALGNGGGRIAKTVA
ncbi:MAG: hypothetical protein R3E46_00020, partial [Sedimenticolaceae bacterium]